MIFAFDNFGADIIQKSGHQLRRRTAVLVSHFLNHTFLVLIEKRISQ